MSTPSTLPPPHHNYGYPHHQNYQPNSGYRANNSSLLNGGSRLGASYTFPTPSSHGTPANNIGVPDPSYPNPNPNDTPSPPRLETRSAAMPASAAVPAGAKSSSKKRQRSREPRGPDWKKFYENGLPSEVIVIDDTPSPEPAGPISASTQAARTVAAANNRHTNKKRRVDDLGPYDPVYHLDAPYPNNASPDYKDTTTSGSASTDRTTSAVHTTAATSLGSHSSNGQHGYEVAAQTGTKRKRQTTRLQTTNEAKRKELEVNGDAFMNYKPPPKPPIKAADVQVKQVADVRIILHLPNRAHTDQTQNSYTKNTKVDDDDGHYIVVPDTDLTERCMSKHPHSTRTIMLTNVQTKSTSSSAKELLEKWYKPETVRARNR